MTTQGWCAAGLTPTGQQAREALVDALYDLDRQEQAIREDLRTRREHGTGLAPGEGPADDVRAVDVNGRPLLLDIFVARVNALTALAQAPEHLTVHHVGPVSPATSPVRRAVPPMLTSENPLLAPVGTLVARNPAYDGGPPLGWALADGTSYPAASFPALTEVLGRAHNLPDDPADTVRLPDLRGDGPGFYIKVTDLGGTQ